MVFFKLEREKSCSSSKLLWSLYHELEHRGFIYYIKGNIRMQITTDKIIYFYLLDEKTLLPTLENCMYNFMGCSQMMTGTRQLYCITYKTGQKGFKIFKRKYNHKFMVKCLA